MEFWKMTGAGNDFIILDNRSLWADSERLSRIAKELCRRRLSIGADGLMAVEPAQAGGDYKMRFYNADGSIGEMCGNGARCICRYGYEMGLAGETQKVETTAGLVTGTRLDKERYRVHLNLPSVLDTQRPTALGLTGYAELGNPGVPHGLLHVPGLKDKTLEELRPMGRALRYDPAYPKGANANLYDFLGPNHVLVRTFERGVEDFTLACGTGTGSLAAYLTVTGQVSEGPVLVENPGGTLQVDVTCEEGKVTKLLLTGPATIVCRGTIEELPL